MPTCRRCKEELLTSAQLCLTCGAKIQEASYQGEVGRSLLGRYVISSLVWETNLGATYLGKDPLQGKVARILALRTPLESAADCASLVRRDGPRLQKLSHPALVPLIASGASEDGRVLLAYEEAPGTLLSDQISGGRTLRLEALLPLLRVASEGLAVLYQEGFAHGLLSPFVFLLRNAGEAGVPVRITENGVAYFTKQGRAPLVRLETQGGAWPYLAPELWKGSGVLDARTDVYSLAVLVYRALSGKLPYFAKEAAGFMNAHCLDPVPTLTTPEGKPAANSEVEDVIRRALSKRREDRPATPALFVQKLTEASQATPLRAQVQAPAPVAQLPRAQAKPQGQPEAAPKERKQNYHDTRPIELTQQIRHRKAAEKQPAQVAAPASQSSMVLWLALLAIAVGVGIGGLIFYLQ